jgi:acyl carrier protein phosphodiesterase
MNFLAHAYLSGNDEHLLVGNFIADFVKGRSALEKFSPEIRRGIALHRSIDAFTDTHPTVALSKDRLRPKYRHYSAVIVDVFYDHFLAMNWSQFHSAPLDVFANHVYHVIEQYEDVLPDRVKEFFPFMVQGNWLLGYSYVEGIRRALTGMARRTPFESKMELAADDLVAGHEEFAREFLQFFPEVENLARTYWK